MVAKETNDMREMLKRFLSFLGKRELTLSAEKSKMIFKKAEGKRKKNYGFETE